MNTADLCPRGRELYAEWMAWHRQANSLPTFIKVVEQKSRAYQAYRQHVDECDYCKELADAVGSQD